MFDLIDYNLAYIVWLRVYWLPLYNCEKIDNPTVRYATGIPISYTS